MVYWSDKPTVDLSEVLSEGIENGRSHRFPLGPLKVVGAVTVLVVLGVGALWLAGFFDRSRQSEGVSTTVVVTTVAPTTTMAATTTAAPTTTAPTTTTTAAPTTTRTLPPPYIEPVGEPLELVALSLSSMGMGDLQFGDPAAQVFGVLAASLGQPDVDSGPFTSTGEHATCPGDVVRAVEWGPLTVISRVDADSGEELFYAFRLEADGGVGDPAAVLQTASGLGLGDPVAELEATYSAAYTVRLLSDSAEGATFQIQGGGTTLIRGTLSSIEPEGIVEGIFSPARCPE